MVTTDDGALSDIEQRDAEAEELLNCRSKLSHKQISSKVASYDVPTSAAKTKRNLKRQAKSSAKAKKSQQSSSIDAESKNLMP